MSNNPWHGLEATWKGDGSEGATLEVTGDSIIHIACARRGTPFNAYCDLSNAPSAASPVDAFFEVTLESLPASASLSVGLVAPEECQPGWKTRGMFFNGNLTNGSAALKTSFGQRLREKDTVGVRFMRSDQESAQVTVVFYHNQRCLGKGFELDAKEVQCGQYFPCLHVDGEAEVSFRIPSELPSAIHRQKQTPKGIYDGEWQMVEALEKGKGPIDLTELVKPVVWNIVKETDLRYAVSIKVGNIINTHFVLPDPPSERRLARIRVTTPTSTLMSVAPALQHVEDFVSKSLPGFHVMELKTDGKLLVEGPSFKVMLETYSGKFSTCKYYKH